MKDRAAIEALIDRWVVPENFDGKPTLDQKVFLLSLVLEELKYAIKTESGRYRRICQPPLRLLKKMLLKCLIFNMLPQDFQNAKSEPASRSEI